MSNHRGFLFPVLLLMTATLLFACNSGDEVFALLEPDGAPQDPSSDQVMRIMERHCTPCHSDADSDEEEDDLDDEEAKAVEAGDDDGEELEHLDFRTCAGVWQYRGDVLRVVLDKTMPPGAWPRLDDAEVLLLQRWVIDNSTVCPCEEGCP